MFPWLQTEKSGLDKAIDQIYIEMAGVSSDSDEYAKMADQLTKLHALKQNEKRKPMSFDTLAVVAGNIFGIMLIVGAERQNVMVSKALNFLLKPKE